MQESGRTELAAVSETVAELAGQVKRQGKVIAALQAANRAGKAERARLLDDVRQLQDGTWELWKSLIVVKATADENRAVGLSLLASYLATERKVWGSNRLPSDIEARVGRVCRWFHETFRENASVREKEMVERMIPVERRNGASRG